jgi:hypothetical protein
MTGSMEVFAHSKNDNVGKGDRAATQLQLLLLNQYLAHLYLHLPPVFYVPVLKLNSNLKKNKFTFPRVQPLKLSWKPEKKWNRAIWLGVAHFIYATSSYWIRQDVMKEDWEYQFTWEDQKKRFLFVDGMRFDSNTFQFNWTHSGAGSMYYNYGRANNLNPFESFLYTFAASYFWEFVIEFKEVVSINDMIATPIGGVSIGEALFQLGRYVRSKRPTIINRLGRFLSNPVLSIYDFWDRKRVKNQFAFKEDVWSDCRFYTGARFDTIFPGTTNTYLNFGIKTQLNLLPDYGEPGEVNRFVNKVVFTQFDLGGTTGSEGMVEFDIFAKTVLFGYFDQDIRTVDRPGSSGDDRVGYSFFLGAATAFDTYKQIPANIPVNEDGPDTNQYEYRTDKYTIINLIGPMLDLSLYYKDFRMRLSADVFGDFSLIHSHAFKRYSELYEFGQTKSTLENHGYYYALGFTLSSMLQFNFSNLELKGKVKYHYFDSIEGLDRFQKDLKDEDDFDLKDHRFNYNISLGYRIPSTGIQLVLGLEQRDRRGYIGEFSRHSNEKRSYFQVRLGF